MKHLLLTADRFSRAFLNGAIAALVFCPMAYAERGYIAVGGEIFLIAIAAAFGWAESEAKHG